MRTSASMACAAETQWIVHFTLRPSRALPLNRFSAVILTLRLRGYEIPVAQPHLAAGRQAVILLGRIFTKIVLLDIEHFRKWHFALPGAFVLGIIDRLDFLHLTFRVVIDHNLQWPQDGHHARRSFV